jgi:hypothetical protein
MLAFLLRDRDAQTRGQDLHGIDESDVLMFGDEGDDVARLAATEALVDATLGIHVKGRRLLLVERTQSGKGSSTLLQAHVFPDHVDDVRLLAYLLDDMVGDAHGIGVTSVRRVTYPDNGPTTPVPWHAASDATCRRRRRRTDATRIDARACAGGGPADPVCR